MPSFFLSQPVACTIDGDEVYFMECAVHRVRTDEAGIVYSITLIPDGKRNDQRFGDVTILLTEHDTIQMVGALLEARQKPAKDARGPVEDASPSGSEVVVQ